MRFTSIRGRFVMFLSLVVALLLFPGCVNTTRYRPVAQGPARDGGYSHSRHSADTYSVTYRGTEYSKTKQIYDFALLRAAELTEECGFKFFTVQATSDRSREFTRPFILTETRYRTDGISYEEPLFYRRTPYRAPISFYDIVNIPIHILTVQMYASREGIPASTGEIREAAPLVAQLKVKYHIK